MTAHPTQPEEETAARQALEAAYLLLGLPAEEAARAATADLQQFAADEEMPWT